MKRKIYPKIALIGHMGIGGVYGLPPIMGDKNKCQQWLESVWDECRERCGVPTHLVIGGEPTEGYNPKGGIEDISIPRLSDQNYYAFQRVMEWVGEETEEIMVLYSHSYHGSASHEIRVEDWLADKLREEISKKGWKTKVLIATQFVRYFYGKTLRFWHGASGSAMYISSANEKEIRLNLINSALDKDNKFDANYEFHGHRYASAGYEGIGSTWTPCFKLLDTGGQLKNPDAWQPTIGMIFITFEKRLGEYRINSDELVYRPPFPKEELEQAKQEFQIRLEAQSQKNKQTVINLLKRGE